MSKEQRGGMMGISSQVLVLVIQIASMAEDTDRDLMMRALEVYCMELKCKNSAKAIKT